MVKEIRSLVKKYSGKILGLRLSSGGTCTLFMPSCAVILYVKYMADVTSLFTS